LRPQHQIPTMASSVSTFAIDPDMKNSSVDWVCEMLSRCDGADQAGGAADTTTRKVSTIVELPEVGPVEPIIVKALPATPAIPQPSRSIAIDLLGIDADGAGHDAVCTTARIASSATCT